MHAKRSEWMKRGLPAVLCVLMSMPGRVAAASVGGAEAHVGIEATYERLRLSPEARQRLRGFLQGREVLLDYLPMAKLEDVVLGPQCIELRFDFGKKDEKCITIPAVKQWVLDAKGRVVKVETEEQDLVIHERVRIDIDAHGALRIRKGDLEGKRGIFRRDLEAYTQRCPNRLVRDDEGRVLLRVDAEGLPLMREGRPVAQTSDEWLVIEAGSRKFEVALSGS